MAANRIVVAIRAPPSPDQVRTALKSAPRMATSSTTATRVTTGVQSASPEFSGAIWMPGQLCESSQAPTSAAPPQCPDRDGCDARPPGTPSGGCGHDQQRDSEHHPGGHRGCGVRCPDCGTKCRGGKDPREAQRRASGSLAAKPGTIRTGNERPRRRRNYLAGPGAARAGATSGRSCCSLDAAVRSGSIAATASVAVSSAAASNPPGAKRSQTTTATTRSSRTTGSSIRDAVSMLDLRCARYDAASVKDRSPVGDDMREQPLGQARRTRRLVPAGDTRDPLPPRPRAGQARPARRGRLRSMPTSTGCDAGAPG